MGAIWTWVKGAVGPILPYVLWALLVVGAYWFGGYNARDKASAVDTAVNSATGQMAAKMTDLTNGLVTNINGQLKEGIDNVVNNYKSNQATIDAEHDQLSLDPDAGVFVTGPVRDATQTTTSTAAGSGPATNGAEYRAQLSDSAQRFFKGEAYRADQCAVDLIAAKGTIRVWKQAVDNYNSTVAAPAKTAAVVLPAEQHAQKAKKE